MSIYLERIKDLFAETQDLVCVSAEPSRSISRYAILFLLRDLITDSVSTAGVGGRPPRTHSVREVFTSGLFLRNCSVDRFWSLRRGVPIQASPPLIKGHLTSVDGFRSLGAFVAVDQVVNPSLPP